MASLSLIIYNKKVSDKLLGFNIAGKAVPERHRGIQPAQVINSYEVEHQVRLD